jgi:hypothetical protein
MQVDIYCVCPLHFQAIFIPRMTTTGGTSTFNNVVVTGSLAANGLSLQSDLKLNGNHNPYASLIFGRGATGQSYSSNFVAGGMSNQKLLFGGTAVTSEDSQPNISDSNVPAPAVNSTTGVRSFITNWWIPGQPVTNGNPGSGSTAIGGSNFVPLAFNATAVVPYLGRGTSGAQVMPPTGTPMPLTAYAVPPNTTTGLSPAISQLQAGNYQMVVQDGANNYFLNLEIATNQLYLVPGFSSTFVNLLQTPEDVNIYIYGQLLNLVSSSYAGELSTFYPNVKLLSNNITTGFIVNPTDQLVLFPDTNGYIPFFLPDPSLTAIELQTSNSPYQTFSDPQPINAYPYETTSSIISDLINSSNFPIALGTNTFAQQLASWMATYPNFFGILTTDGAGNFPGSLGYTTTYSYLPPYLLGLASVPTTVANSSQAAANAAASQFPLAVNSAAAAAVAANAQATPFQFVQDYIVQLQPSSSAVTNLPSYLPQSWNGALVEYDTSNFGYFSYLQYAGMHYWGIFPSGSGTLQYDSNANKFVASLMNDETYTQALQAGTVGQQPNLIANGRLAIEGGAIISNVIANPSSDALVPQFILQNGSEKWRLALITDMGDANGDGGVMKLAIQRLNTTTLIWETIDDFQSDTQQQNGQAVYTNLLTSQGITETALGSETAYLQAEQAVQPTPFDFTDPIGDALTDSTNASDPNIQIQSTSDSSSS